MNHGYTPSENDKSVLVWNSLFIDEEDIEYAVKNRYSVLLTETSGTSTFELIHRMLKLGYELETLEEPHIIDGSEPGVKLTLNPHLYAKFIYTNKVALGNSYADIKEDDEWEGK